MFLFLRRRALRYLAAAVLLPVLGAVAVKASNEWEARHGQTTASKALKRVGLSLKRKPSTA